MPDFRSGTYQIVAADLDGDLIVDVAVVSQDSYFETENNVFNQMLKRLMYGSLETFKGDGSGGFSRMQLPWEWLHRESETEGASADNLFAGGGNYVVVADIDGDGDRRVDSNPGRPLRLRSLDQRSSPCCERRQ